MKTDFFCKDVLFQHRHKHKVDDDEPQYIIFSQIDNRLICDFIQFFHFNVLKIKQMSHFSVGGGGTWEDPYLVG